MISTTITQLKKNKNHASLDQASWPQGVPRPQFVNHGTIFLPTVPPKSDVKPMHTISTLSASTRSGLFQLKMYIVWFCLTSTDAKCRF